MCGIYMTNMPVEEALVKAKLKKINHRGPDHLGITKKENIFLGHLRLSILDLEERSNQPFVFKHLSLVFNGEIYNFLDVKKELVDLGYTFDTTSDTEVLLKGYDAWGKGVLDKINGMFAFAILDSNQGEVFCARDRLGVKPFYYYWEKGKFEICSQLQPLINEDSVLCEKALSIFLDYGYIPSPYSILKNVFKLQAGKYLILNLKKNTKEIVEYWDLKKYSPINISYEDAKSRLHSLLKDAVKIRMQSDVPFGTFLSGGVDSALITAISSKISDQKIKSFTIGFEEAEYDESNVAENFAQILGTEHSTTFCKSEDMLELVPELIETFDEPFADSSALPSLLLNRVTKKSVTVALSGDGGDESFLGYVHFDLLAKFNRIKRIPYFLRKIVSRLPFYKLFGIKKETYNSFLRNKSSYEFSHEVFSWFDTLLVGSNKKWKKYYNKHYSNNSFQYQADYNIKLWLENDSNVKVDRTSMKYSMEIRSPFLDYRIIEFARQLPVSYRYNDGRKKIILKDILEEYIPREEFELPKKGFSVPLAKWISGGLRDDIKTRLDDEFLQSIPGLNVRKVKNQIDRHMNGGSDNSFTIWKLYVLNKWLDKNQLKF